MRTHRSGGSRLLGLPIVLGAVVLLALAAPVSAGGQIAEARDGHLTGVDVSHWQGKVGWRAARDAGVRFVIAKATDGRSFVDGQYARNRLKADELGLLFTAYHFARPSGGSADAIAEADHFVDTARLLGRHMLPVLDLELHGGLGTAKLIRWTKAWLARVESRLGVKPMIYTGPVFWQERMGNSRWFADNGYRLWIAHWFADQPRLPAAGWGGRVWTVWQVTDCGRVPGFNSCVDVDLLRGTDVRGLTIKSRRAAGG